MTVFTMMGALTRMASRGHWPFEFRDVPHTLSPREKESGAAINTSKVTAVARVAELMLLMASTSRINMPTGTTIRRTKAG